MPKSQFKRVPLSASRAAEYIVEHYGGKTNPVKRKEIAECVLKAHLDIGGLPPTRPLIGVVKKALTTLKAEGKAINDRPYWVIHAQSLSGLQSKTESEPPQKSSESDDEREPIAEFELGTGKECVYAIYLPVYRREAINSGCSCWRMKIGRSSDVDSRIRDLTSSGTPEPYEIGVLLRTDRSSVWERVLHGLLTLAGRHIELEHATEWFYTNPEELGRWIVELTKSIDARHETSPSI